MGIKPPTVVMTLAVALLLSAGAAGRAGQEAQPAPGAGYAWADGCKSCHANIYTAWSQTKHARTINRLNAENQLKECIGCHTTGPGGKIEKDGKFVNANVQCESCHGAAAAHAADPAVRTGLVRKPKSRRVHGLSQRQEPALSWLLLRRDAQLLASRAQVSARAPSAPPAAS
jgi:hypothetical protein